MTTIEILKEKFSDLILEESIESYPSIYLIQNNLHKIWNVYPYLYSGSDFHGRSIEKYSGSSILLKNDIDIYGLEMFSKKMIASFVKSISRKKLREIESFWQKLEFHRNSILFYNLTDRTGPGMPMDYYKGDTRTTQMKIGHENLKQYRGENRTKSQKKSDKNKRGRKRSENEMNADIVRRSYNKSNEKTPQSMKDGWEKLKESGTEWRMRIAEKLSLRVGENRTDFQKIRDEKMRNYKGDRRTDKQKKHDYKMSILKGDNRTDNQKAASEIMKTYKGDNRTENQRKSDNQIAIRLGKKCTLISPDGDEINIISIRKFSIEYKLYRISIMKLISKQIDEYKGWKLKN